MSLFLKMKDTVVPVVHCRLPLLSLSAATTATTTALSTTTTPPAAALALLVPPPRSSLASLAAAFNLRCSFLVSSLDPHNRGVLTARTHTPIHTNIQIYIYLETYIYLHIYLHTRSHPALFAPLLLAPFISASAPRPAAPRPRPPAQSLRRPIAHRRLRVASSSSPAYPLLVLACPYLQSQTDR